MWTHTPPEHRRMTRVPSSVFSLAYVVQVHNAVNFDLDLENLPQDLLDGIEPKKYAYVEKEEDRSDLYKHRDGRVYRCRVQHLSRVPGSTQQDFNEAQRHIVRRIDKLDGWIYVRPVMNSATRGLALDSYDRILVDIFDPLTSENIAEWILATFPGVIQRYTPHNGPSRNHAFARANNKSHRRTHTAGRASDVEIRVHRRSEEETDSSSGGESPPTFRVADVNPGAWEE